jgi:hypothetical protein
MTARTTSGHLRPAPPRGTGPEVNTSTNNK